MKTRSYIITAVVAYALFLVASTPATTVNVLSEQFPQLNIQGAHGSLWNGSARRVVIASTHTLEDVNWSFCGWRLLTGELCVQLDASFNDSPLYGEFGASIGGSLRTRNLSYEVDALKLGNLAGLPVGKLSGNVFLEISSASWSRGSAPVADGTITWGDAAITVAETASLGTVSIVLSETDDDALNARITGKGGQIELDGNASLIDDGTYKLNLNLIPGKQASKNILGSLAMFARKQGDGSFVVTNSGNISQFGLM